MMQGMCFFLANGQIYRDCSTYLQNEDEVVSLFGIFIEVMVGGVLVLHIISQLTDHIPVF